MVAFGSAAIVRGSGQFCVQPLPRFVEFKTFNGTTSIKEVSARYVFVIFFFFFGFVAMT